MTMTEHTVKARNIHTGDLVKYFLDDLYTVVAVTIFTDSTVTIDLELEDELGKINAKMTLTEETLVTVHIPQ